MPSGPLAALLPGLRFFAPKIHPHRNPIERQNAADAARKFVPRIREAPIPEIGAQLMRSPFCNSYPTFVRCTVQRGSACRKPGLRQRIHIPAPTPTAIFREVSRVTGVADEIRRELLRLPHRQEIIIFRSPHERGFSRMRNTIAGSRDHDARIRFRRPMLFSKRLGAPFAFIATRNLLPSRRRSIWRRCLPSGRSRVAGEFSALPIFAFSQTRVPDGDLE